VLTRARAPQDGWTALHRAADVMPIDRANGDLCHDLRLQDFAARLKASEEVVWVLLDAGANPNAKPKVKGGGWVVCTIVDLLLCRRSCFLSLLPRLGECRISHAREFFMSHGGCMKRLGHHVF